MPIVLPIRERGLVVGSFFAFEGDGVLKLIESSIREALPERAAGCSAPLGTDGLVVLIVLPIREVKLGLTRLFELVLNEFEGLSDGVFVFLKESIGKEYLGLIELSIRDVIPESTRPLELVPNEVEGLL